MPTECNPELFEFPPVAGRRVVASFDGGLYCPQLLGHRTAPYAAAASG
jgi:hypothetical protein